MYSYVEFDIPVNSFVLCTPKLGFEISSYHIGWSSFVSVLGWNFSLTPAPLSNYVRARFSRWTVCSSVPTLPASRNVNDFVASIKLRVFGSRYINSVAPFPTQYVLHMQDNLFSSLAIHLTTRFSVLYCPSMAIKKRYGLRRLVVCLRKYTQQFLFFSCCTCIFGNARDRRASVLSSSRQGLFLSIIGAQVC